MKHKSRSRNNLKSNKGNYKRAGYIELGKRKKKSSTSEKYKLRGKEMGRIEETSFKVGILRRENLPEGLKWGRRWY